ncbi:MAG TPA: DUF3782 domain-containing protein [Thermoanaerobaculia bacterium]|nr:DUF3782 domain-containing protein [Thermoanaerobaculia bacterium]
MTDVELKELVANLAVRQTDSEHRFERTEQYLEQVARDLAESAQSRKDLDRQQQETARQQQETARQIKDLGRQTDQYLEQAARDLAESAQNHKELDRRQQETARQIKELGQETDRRIKETDQQIKELGRQIGGLGEKFGGFTEGMAYPSLKKILEQKFQMTTVSPRVTSRKNGRTMELDVLAYSNSTVNEVYVVEVKSHLHESGLDQMLRILREFHDFFPGHQGKKVYGILAAVDAPDNLRQRVLKAGIYMANVHADTFQLQVPDDFQPHAY